VREETSLDVKRGDFKLDTLSPHLFMNFRVVDDMAASWAPGRNLGALKAELGPGARGVPGAGGLKGRRHAGCRSACQTPGAVPAGALPHPPRRRRHTAATVAPAVKRYTAWTFGELPELLEIRKGGQTLIGFPALIDAGDAVQIEVFDEPDVAAAKHRAGLRRLFALQIKDALKYLEKNIPDLQKMAVAYMRSCRWARWKSCARRSSTSRWSAPFLLDPLPADEAAFKRRWRRAVAA
jgi:ATP-dependent helicase HrpA